MRTIFKVIKHILLGHVLSKLLPCSYIGFVIFSKILLKIWNIPSFSKFILRVYTSPKAFVKFFPPQTTVPLFSMGSKLKYSKFWSTLIFGALSSKKFVTAWALCSAGIHICMYIYIYIYTYIYRVDT